MGNRGSVRSDGTAESDSILPLLSRDIFFIISRYLSVEDICNACRSCRTFNHMGMSDQVWSYRLRTTDFAPYALYEPSGRHAGRAARDVFKELWVEARERRVAFDPVVGGNVRFEEGEAVFFQSYATVRSGTTFETGVHYVEFELIFASHYAGLGVLEPAVPLPEAGRGAWLSPSGATMWVTGSGLWKDKGHLRNCSEKFQSGDRVGVLLDLERLQLHFYLNGQLTPNSCAVEPPVTVCLCVGDGRAKITQTYLPRELPQ